MNGIINLHKPVGPTSFQMIARLRKLTGIRKIGHAGTLDPLASGVLPICIGKAVRLSEYLMSDDKVYDAEITFGITTTTDDAEGEISARHDVSLTREQIAQVLPEFVGEQQQVPPQFAAIKIDGRPMYERARRGEQIEAAPRSIVIKSLTVREWQSPRLRLEVACSKGTYVRALARDLGERLGCGAYLSGLVRTQSGAFTLENSVTLDALQADWRAHLLPMDYGLQAMPLVHLSADDAARITRGMVVERAEPVASPLVRAYDERGQFIAIVRVDEGVLRPEKVFAEGLAHE